MGLEKTFVSRNLFCSYCQYLVTSLIVFITTEYNYAQLPTFSNPDTINFFIFG